ncbi:tRNA-uridine aminocarboxypropyltransferase 2 isoform X1 [Schistocerca nitens]|uniref:tRNA-uridine aminocarboxypropyltransferase 2 isoform X1 n=1 Tax=Schistocerca nitens TaxID=7011 RepID=UPI0021196C83|nr:tRNA-uridine aminocarboxypropyltransferase 2 isoform X1 [Schistocerca nitens]
MSDIDDVWDDLSGLPADPPRKREICPSCRRPAVVCWCPYLPKTPLDIQCRLILLQHPAEEKRCLRTAPMLSLGLSPGKCLIFKGKKFPLNKHIGLEEILKSPDALLLYPSKDAVEIFRLPSVSERKSPYDLIVIDGTWPQAKAIFHATPLLHNIRQVKLVHGLISEYVIRSQPTDGCLSTLEAAAQALSHLEDRADVTDVLLRPMHALCNFQLDYGAVTHSSTEARVRNGTYPRQIGKRLSRLLAANSEIDDTSCT